jgi:hypothetical protein
MTWEFPKQTGGKKVRLMPNSAERRAKQPGAWENCPIHRDVFPDSVRASAWRGAKPNPPGRIWRKLMAVANLPWTEWTLLRKSAEPKQKSKPEAGRRRGSEADLPQAPSLSLHTPSGFQPAAFPGGQCDPWWLFFSI